MVARFNKVISVSTLYIKSYILLEVPSFANFTKNKVSTLYIKSYILLGNKLNPIILVFNNMFKKNFFENATLVLKVAYFSKFKQSYFQ